ncbi:MAG: ribonuclease D [Thermoanaerobaculia bacterium]
MKWVRSSQELSKLTREISTLRTLAIDTEADSLHSYFDKVCLIQLSDEKEDYLIDPLADIDLQPFGAILSDKAITKIFHGADYDLRILDRDFGIEVHNLVDTMICAQLLGYEAFGLAALLKRHFDLEVDKSHQRADWSMRPITPEMARYAAMDTHYLIRLAVILRDELRALGRWEWAEEEFLRLEAIRFHEDEDQERFRKIKGAAKLDRRSLALLAKLYQWRDGRARRADKPPFRILGNEAMIEIARTFPEETRELLKIKGVSSYHLSHFADEILGAVRDARQLDESELPEKIDPRPWRRDNALERRIDRLKRVRNEVAASLKIEPSVVAPRHLLAAVAEMRPSSPEELDQIPAMRRWQRDVLGEKLVAALALETSPQDQ